jgi:hypothetical protein
LLKHAQYSAGQAADSHSAQALPKPGHMGAPPPLPELEMLVVALEVALEPPP